MIRVFLVDDHEVVRRGIAQLIDAQADLEVVGESETVRGALGRIEATLPEVVVLDVHLPDRNGIDLCRTIRSAHPEIPCLILTAYDEDAASLAAVIAGAAGYVPKNIRGHNLVEAIRRAARGETSITADLARRVRDSLSTRMTREPSTHVQLTMRERQVLDLITDGLTNRQIGERLILAEKTVKNYVSGLFAKLGIERRTQAASSGATERAHRDDR